MLLKKPDPIINFSFFYVNTYYYLDLIQITEVVKLMLIPGLMETRFFTDFPFLSSF